MCRVLILLIAGSGLFACAARQPLPEDGFVDVPGGRVAFRVIGGGDAVPVLLIHGGPDGTSCSYVSTVDGLASKRAVVVYDQLGSGNSDRMLDLERDAQLARFVKEVAAIRAELGLREVHLAGHSWGGTVALEYLLTTSAAGVRYGGGQVMLGHNYDYGNGVPQDFVLAYAWLNLGASQGEEKARSARDSVAEKFTPSELAEAQRLSSRWKSGKGIEREPSR